MRVQPSSSLGESSAMARLARQDRPRPWARLTSARSELTSVMAACLSHGPVLQPIARPAKHRPHSGVLGEVVSDDGLEVSRIHSCLDPYVRIVPESFCDFFIEKTKAYNSP